MKTIRKTSFWLVIPILSFLGMTSCLNDTYDLDTLSSQAELSPEVALKIATARFTLGNAIESTDTIRFNDDNTISIVLEEDSIMSFDVSELIEIPSSLPETGPETKTFSLGELDLGSFSASQSISLGDICSNLPSPYGTNISDHDGETLIFPAIDPAQDAGSYTFSAFDNYSEVTFASGYLSLSLTNNLPVVLEPVTVRLIDANSTEVGTVSFTNVAANGGEQTQEIDLTGLTLINNEYTAEILAFGTPGSGTDPVLISLTDDIVLDIQTRDISISTGTAVLPDQVFAEDSSSVDLDLEDEEVYEIILKSAHINYTVTSNILEDIRVNIILPSSKVDGDTAKYEAIIPYNSGNPTSGTIELQNVVADLTTDPDQAYNILPFKYEIEIVSSDNLISFDLSNDMVLEFSVTDIEFSYIEGYFGKMVESFDKDTITIEDDVLDQITGSFELADPKIKFFYTNSFGLPIELALDVTGYFEGGSSVDLGASAEIISYPTDTLDLFITDTLSYDKDNTALEELLVFPTPYEIIYSGSATVNPEEDRSENNFVTDESRIELGLKAEIPLDFSASNLSLTDTVEVDVGDDFDWSDIAYTKLYIGIDTNWFPFDLDFQITPYNSEDNTMGTPVDITVLTAAEVNSDGIVEQPTSSTSVIDLESEFFSDLSVSDHLIIKVNFSTSGGGTQAVKILTSYCIRFNFGLLTEYTYSFEF